MKPYFMSIFSKMSLIFILFLIFSSISCQKNSTNTDKYCTEIIDAFTSGSAVFVIYDKQGKKMEIPVTQTDFKQYVKGSTICLDKDYKIYR